MWSCFCLSDELVRVRFECKYFLLIFQGSYKNPKSFSGYVQKSIFNNTGDIFLCVSFPIALSIFQVCHGFTPLSLSTIYFLFCHLLQKYKCNTVNLHYVFKFWVINSETISRKATVFSLDFVFRSKTLSSFHLFSKSDNNFGSGDPYESNYFHLCNAVSVFSLVKFCETKITFKLTIIHVYNTKKSSFV